MPVFRCKLRRKQCILHQNALHLASKRIAFSTKTHCILHQNALHLASKRTAFSIKTHYNLVLLAFLHNRKHVQNMPNNTLNTGVLVPKSQFSRDKIMRAGNNLERQNGAKCNYCSQKSGERQACKVIFYAKQHVFNP